MLRLAQKFLTSAEKEAVINAVREVEKHTSGEIVPLIVSASHRYQRADMAGALCLGLIGGIAANLAFESHDMWSFLEFFALMFIISYFLVSRITALKYFFATDEEMNAEVDEAASSSFYNNSLHRTRESTGILIYVSVFERKVRILADKGINDKVGEDAWKDIVSGVIADIRRGRPGEGLCKAVERCGELIRTHFPRRADDTDELSNLIIQDEPIGHNFRQQG